ncbi:MAG TPA: ATP-binding protein [Gaiellaceae bacterium]|nr:ATP-binding protein [Gaiellaceae bacterium]
MPRPAIGMRWWLSFAFALIAAVTAAVVAQIFSQRSEAAFRERAQALAVGNSVAAAEAVSRSVREGRLRRSLADIAERRRLSLYVLDEDGQLLTPEESRGFSFASVPDGREAVERVFDGERHVATHDDGRTIVVGLRLRAGDAGALIAYAVRPELTAEVSIVRTKIIEAALLAVLFGAAVGLLIAVLIAARLRRIAAAAAAIEGGSFDRPLHAGFRDELGSLAASIDRMRVRLRESFQALRSDRDRLHRLLARLREGVVTVDPELRVDFANPSAAQMLGVGRLREGDPLPDPWPGFPLRDIAAGLFRSDAAVAEARVASGDERTFALVGIPAGPGTQTAILVLADVTERERRERAEREFVTNAAHELRTPLAAITSAVEVLQAGAKELPEDRDRFLESIERQSARLGRLTHTLLTLARAQTQDGAPRLEPLELRPVLDEIAATLKPKPGVEVVVECPPGLLVLAERALVEQALLNLAVNAAKHTEQGRIELAAERLANGSAAVEVRDSGPGIAPADQERVWERFYRGRGRDADGFGLGLAIVRQAIRVVGGNVELESAPGKGTVVRVTLRLAEQEVA